MPAEDERHKSTLMACNFPPLVPAVGNWYYSLQTKEGICSLCYATGVALANGYSGIRIWQKVKQLEIKP